MRLFIKSMILSLGFLLFVGGNTVFAKPSLEQLQMLQATENHLLSIHDDYVKGSLKLKTTSSQLESNTYAFLIEYQTVRDSLFRITHREVVGVNSKENKVITDGDILNSAQFNSFKDSVKNEIGGELHSKGPIIIFIIFAFLLYIIVTSMDQRHTYKKGEVIYNE